MDFSLRSIVISLIRVQHCDILTCALSLSTPHYRACGESPSQRDLYCIHVRQIEVTYRACTKSPVRTECIAEWLKSLDPAGALGSRDAATTL